MGRNWDILFFADRVIGLFNVYDIIIILSVICVDR
jgi:hypothetical protein